VNEKYILMIALTMSSFFEMKEEPLLFH
jgi:hypothetical protein